MMAAESGYAAAQFNVAYLCEQNTVSYLHIRCGSMLFILSFCSFLSVLDVHVFTLYVHS